jgi:hypothetical protein
MTGAGILEIVGIILALTTVGFNDIQFIEPGIVLALANEFLVITQKAV